jgi:hypothetical protein
VFDGNPIIGYHKTDFVAVYEYVGHMDCFGLQRINSTFLVISTMYDDANSLHCTYAQASTGVSLSVVCVVDVDV